MSTNKESSIPSSVPRGMATEFDVLKNKMDEAKATITVLSSAIKILSQEAAMAYAMAQKAGKGTDEYNKQMTIKVAKDKEVIEAEDKLTDARMVETDASKQLGTMQNKNIGALQKYVSITMDSNATLQDYNVSAQNFVYIGQQMQQAVTAVNALWSASIDYEYNFAQQQLAVIHAQISQISATNQLAQANAMNSLIQETTAGQTDAHSVALRSAGNAAVRYSNLLVSSAQESVAQTKQALTMKPWEDFASILTGVGQIITSILVPLALLKVAIYGLGAAATTETAVAGAAAGAGGLTSTLGVGAIQTTMSGALPAATGVAAVGLGTAASIVGGVAAIAAAPFIAGALTQTFDPEGWKKMTDRYEATIAKINADANLSAQYAEAEKMGYGGTFISAIEATIPSHQLGGTQLQTGLAMVHAGETIIPADLTETLATHLLGTPSSMPLPSQLNTLSGAAGGVAQGSSIGTKIDRIEFNINVSKEVDLSKVKKVIDNALSGSLAANKTYGAG